MLFCAWNIKKIKQYDEYFVVQQMSRYTELLHFVFLLELDVLFFYLW